MVMTMTQRLESGRLQEWSFDQQFALAIQDHLHGCSLTYSFSFAYSKHNEPAK
jgi:hypothetical protein